MKIIKILALVPVFLLSTSTELLAQSQNGANQQTPLKPPKESVDACASKKEGDACSFTGLQNETVSGSCRKGPRGEGVIACAPSVPPPHQQPGGTGGNEGMSGGVMK